MQLYARISQSAKRYIGFRDHYLMVGGILFLAFVMPLVFFGKKLNEGFITYCPHWAVGILFTTVFWLGNRYLVILFRKRYPSLKDNRKRIIRQSIAMIVLTITTSFLLNFLESVIRTYFDVPMESHNQLSTIGASLFSTLTVVSIYEALYYVQMWKKSIAEAEMLKKENALSQFETLKNQVNPHFLFNSLNTLASIIPEDPEKAVSFVQKLSQVYRHILEIREKELIPLSEELDAIYAYLFLLRARFGDSFQVEADIPDEAKRRYVVPLSLQMLLENAVKHNIVSAKRPLKVLITLDKNGDLLVKNNLQLRGQIADSTGMGLRNISRRYKLLSERDIEVMQGEEFSTVIIPLLEVRQHESIDN